MGFLCWSINWDDVSNCDDHGDLFKGKICVFSRRMCKNPQHLITQDMEVLESCSVALVFTR